jgi:secreted Zn-dependent insulinase-like peptidase
MFKNKIKNILIAISLILLFISFMCGAQTLPKGVSIHTLDNGLQVLMIENPALPMVGVNTVVKVGSAYETFATSGMSHMLEHLLFNGTTSRTQKQLYDDTDRIGGYNNANTSEYFTNYMMVTPSDNIVNGMEIQADMLFNSILPEAKFQKEKGIVLEEISKSLGSPDEQINRNLISILYKGHALSLPTLGTYATIEAMDRDIVYKFYKNNYVPNNMILSVIGNFNSKDMLNNINKIYGKYPPSKVTRGMSENWSLGFDDEFLTEPKKNSIYHRFYDGEELQLQLLFDIPSDHTSAFYSLLETKLEDTNSKLEDVLTEKFGENFQSIKIQTSQSILAAYLEANLIITDTAIDEIVESVNNYLQNYTWEFAKEKLDTEAIKSRTGFLKNIEKPHMFGIYNAHEFAVNGIEAVLASYSSDIYYKAAEKLQQFNIGSEPIIILQHPTKTETEAVGNTVVKNYMSLMVHPLL